MCRAWMWTRIGEVWGRKAAQMAAGEFVAKTGRADDLAGLPLLAGAA